MKIVINRKYGGFSISSIALLELIRMNSKVVTKISAKEYHGGNNPRFKDRWKESLEDAKSKLEEFHDGFSKDSFMSDTLFKDDTYYYIENHDNKLRSHPDLIKVVEQLKDQANGSCAQLKIVDIPNNTDYYIDEYDGMESVHEQHESWP